MKFIKLGAAALNQTPLDWSGNKQNITNVIDQAIQQDVDILCLPELCITGYGCEDAFFMPHVRETAFSILEDIAVLSDNIIVSVGLPVEHNGAIYNCSAIISQNRIQYIVPKRHLCADGIHYEPRWFKPWTSDKSERLSDHNIDIGNNVVFLADGIKLGFEICEDAWVSNRPGSRLAQVGVDVILNPSASHFSFDKDKIRKRFIEEGSRSLNSAYVYSNLLGNESGRVIFDGDTYIASGGRIITEGQRFSFKDNILTTAIVDVDKNLVKRSQNFSHNPCNGKDVPLIYTIPVPRKYNIEHKESLPLKDTVTYSKSEQFSKAVSLGLWDYLRKTHSNGFVVSLSGGADSAAVACLVYEMVWNTCKELGCEEVAVQLNVSHIPNSPYIESIVKSITKEILTCVYQKTQNSSETTEQSARNLANNIGATYHCIDVQEIVNLYIDATSSMLNRNITWDTDDIALQNIQARARAPSVWMIANIKNALLLSTSNRSEAAVGYATMDGDTCGGLSPIAGISKEFLIQWLNYYCSNKRLDSLSNIVKLKPTAELRPKDDNQSDEDDLMPYSILNIIETNAVVHKMSPQDIVTTLKNQGVEKAEQYVQKFFTLFTRNQWKRERYAPSFHLDDESLDPKTFYRFPILNSGFKEEIKELSFKK